MTDLAIVKKPLDEGIIHSLVIDGDLAKLTPAQRVAYYEHRCRALGVDPAEKPFELLKLSGRLVMYCSKAGANALTRVNRLSVKLVDRTIDDGLIIITARATAPDGQYADDIGVVDTKDDSRTYANAIMAAATKAKRRAVIALVGLGLIDASELTDIAGATRVDFNAETGEILDAQVVQRRSPAPQIDGPRCNGPRTGAIAAAIRSRVEDLADHREEGTETVYASACRIAGLDGASDTTPEQLSVDNGLAIATVLKRQRFEEIGPEGAIGDLLADIAELSGSEWRSVLSDAIAQAIGVDAPFLSLKKSQLCSLEELLEAMRLELDPPDSEVQA